jgi:Na+/H+ antiporter NhaD/arsenite permease-like protein
MRTESPNPFDCEDGPLNPGALALPQIVAAYLIFLASYLVFAIGKFPGMKIDRPAAAVIGGVLMVAVRVVGPRDAVGAVDFATIVLLFSMMLLVAGLKLAGFFEWAADWVIAHMHARHLLGAVVVISGVLSAFFVNDIVCLVMAPLLLHMTRRMGVRPVPYLLALATASNIGSVATITGNPQNMVIGATSGIAYRDFLAHLGPVAIVGLLIDWAMLHWIFGGDLRVEATAGAVAEAEQTATLAERQGMAKPVIIVLVVIAGFLAGVPPAMMAAVGAAVLLITRTREPRQLYKQVDWGLLIFFVGLFVIVRGAEDSGLVGEILRAFGFLNLQRPASFTVVVVLLSNLVSNVPAVMLLRSLVPHFTNPHTGWLLLAMSSTLAGNLTITGSVANIIVVERARPEAEIGFRQYFAVGLPVTVATVAFGALWLSWIG